jgi:hypothetical protein
MFAPDKLAAMGCQTIGASEPGRDKGDLDETISSSIGGITCHVSHDVHLFNVLILNVHQCSEPSVIHHRLGTRKEQL